MVKHTQTIRRQQPTTCVSVFDHFVGWVLKRLIQTVNICSKSLLTQCSISVLPENMIRPFNFWLFSGGAEIKHWPEMG